MVGSAVLLIRWRMRLGGAAASGVAVVLAVVSFVARASWALVPAALLLVAGVLAMWLSTWLPDLTRPTAPAVRARVVLVGGVAVAALVGAVLSLPALARSAVPSTPAAVPADERPAGAFVRVRQGDPVALAGGGTLDALLEAQGTSLTATLVFSDAADESRFEGLGTRDEVVLPDGRVLTVVRVAPLWDTWGLRPTGGTVDVVVGAAAPAP